jgi:Arc/MetJ-type ribon-helix-helix transcriptional regulator
MQQIYPTRGRIMSITIPPDQVHALDEVVPPGKRSAAVREAIAEWVARQKIRQPGAPTAA